ncbi:Tyrosinase_Cu-bd domain-containing protein [Psidium guajava]|nr:Tyrosinase_Cu-bd domain-containing protein [Psidium guajava]
MPPSSPVSCQAIGVVGERADSGEHVVGTPWHRSEQCHFVRGGVSWGIIGREKSRTWREKNMGRLLKPDPYKFCGSGLSPLLSSTVWARPDQLLSTSWDHHFTEEENFVQTILSKVDFRIYNHRKIKSTADEDDAASLDTAFLRGQNEGESHLLEGRVLLFREKLHGGQTVLSWRKKKKKKQPWSIPS